MYNNHKNIDFEQIILDHGEQFLIIDNFMDTESQREHYYFSKEKGQFIGPFYGFLCSEEGVELETFDKRIFRKDHGDEGWYEITHLESETKEREDVLSKNIELQNTLYYSEISKHKKIDFTC